MASNDDITLVFHERLSRHYVTEGRGHSRFSSNSPRLGGKNTKWFKKKVESIHGKVRISVIYVPINPEYTLSPLKSKVGFDG